MTEDVCNFNKVHNAHTNDITELQAIKVHHEQAVAVSTFKLLIGFHKLINQLLISQGTFITGIYWMKL